MTEAQAREKALAISDAFNGDWKDTEDRIVKELMREANATDREEAHRILLGATEEIMAWHRKLHPHGGVIDLDEPLLGRLAEAIARIRLEAHP